MSDTILDVRNLQVQFSTEGGPLKAVNDISFTLQRGKTLAIVGESGSGKSVTSLAIMRLVPNPGEISHGEVIFSPQSDEAGNPPLMDSKTIALHQVAEKQMQHYRGSKIAMIFQEPMSSLNPVFTCGYQLLEAICQHQDIPAPEARRRAIALLQEVKLIPHDDELKEIINKELGNPKLADANLLKAVNERKQSFLRRYPHELSGGQIQRVMIAMAISSNPDILIADEPTTALDVTVQARILDLLRELRDRRGMSILFVTHDLGIVAELADDVVVMYQGKIVEFGTVRDIFLHPKDPYTQGLLACRPQPDKQLRYLPTVSDFINDTETAAEGRIEANTSNANTSNANTSEAGVATKTEPLKSEEISNAEMETRLEALLKTPPLVRVENLRVYYPVRGVFGATKRYVTAVNGVSFNIHPGETLGLVGESGCGKTTLGRTLVRLIEATDGEIYFENQNITRLKGEALRSIRHDMQIIFQDPYSALDPRMSVGAAIAEPMHIYKEGPKKGRNKRIRDRCVDLLERVGLSGGDLKRYPHEFSGGQRQRICIARALALNPKFIICDESVSALDVSVQAQVLNLLKELQQEFNLTYVFISHDLGVVKFMSDRIIVMNKKGEIEEMGPAAQIYNSPAKAYTQQLIAAIPKGMPPAA